MTYFAFAVVMWFVPEKSFAQERTYSVTFQKVQLADALQHLAREAGVPLIYETELVDSYQVHCVKNNEPIELILQCMLRETPLDFIQLSSGTFVIKERQVVESRWGYLTGTVIDRETRVPIPSAHVMLLSHAGGKGTTTNSAGQFVFPRLLPGEYEVLASHVSYGTWKDTLTVTAEVRVETDIALASNPIVITPIIIDGLQHRPPAEAIVAEQVGLMAPEIGFAAGSNGSLVQQVNSMMGVRVSDVTADVHLQGGGAGEHQFRLDGAPLFLPRSVIGVITPMSVFAIDKLQVYKAGYSVALGSQVSGVIQAEHALQAKNEVNAQLDAHSLNVQLNGFRELKNGKSFTAMVAGRNGLWDFHRPEGLRTLMMDWSAPDSFILFGPIGVPELATKDLLERDDFAGNGLALFYTDIHLASRIQLTSSSSIKASAYWGDTRLGSDGITVFSNIEVVPDGHSINDDYAWSYSSAQVQYNSLLANNTLFSLQARSSLSRADHDYILSYGFAYEEDPEFPGEYVQVNSTEPISDINEIEEYALEGKLERAVDIHHLQVGAELTRNFSYFELLFARLNVESFTYEEWDGSEVMEDYVYIDRFFTRNKSDAVRAAFFAEDRIALNTRLQLEVGVRGTFMHGELYSEPRLSLRYDQQNAQGAQLSMRTTVGLFRQYVNQIDISSLNAGEVLSSTRIWMPIDKTVRPSTMLHVSHSIFYKPEVHWTLRFEGYYKQQYRGLVMNYASSAALWEYDYDFSPDGPYNALFSSPTGSRLDQASFLTEVEGKYYGFSSSVDWEHQWLRTRAKYAYSFAEQRGDELFDGRKVTVPWNEPHRLDLSVDFLLTGGLNASIRGKGIWGRSWGYRRAYYNYLGQIPATRWYGDDIDLGRPEDHKLPALYQVDLGLAYSLKQKDNLVQLRMDLLNVFDRENVLNWRLVYDEGQGRLTKSRRLLYGRMPVFGLRVKF